MTLSLLYFVPGAGVACFRAGRAFRDFTTRGLLPTRVSPLPVWLLLVGGALAAN